MIPLNTPTTLPASLIWYALAKIALMFFIIPLPFMLLVQIMLLVQNAGLFTLFLSFVIVIALPTWLYTIISYRFVSFAVSEHIITINSGIFVKHSNAISFGQIQNVTNTKGPLAALFGLSQVNIWTASPSQIQIRNAKSNHIAAGFLWLKTADAEWLKNIILEKRS